MNKLDCLNCGAPLKDDYCSCCGQEASTGKITFKDTLDHFLSSTFSLEGPFLFTVRSLISNPGKVFRDYIVGKRKTYYKPVSFFVLLTAIYLILKALLQFDPLEGQMEQSGPQAMSKIKETARFMVSNVNNILFFLVFSIALMMKLFFNKKYNLAEYTSIGFFITGLYILFGILMMLITKFGGFKASSLQLLILALLIAYSSGSLFKSFTFWALIKYLLVSVFSLVLYIVLGFGFSFLIISLK